MQNDHISKIPSSDTLCYKTYKPRVQIQNRLGYKNTIEFKLVIRSLFKKQNYGPKPRIFKQCSVKSSIRTIGFQPQIQTSCFAPCLVLYCPTCSYAVTCTVLLSSSLVSSDRGSVSCSTAVLMESRSVESSVEQSPECASPDMMSSSLYSRGLVSSFLAPKFCPASSPSDRSCLSSRTS